MLSDLEYKLELNKIERRRLELEEQELQIEKSIAIIMNEAQTKSAKLRSDLIDIQNKLNIDIPNYKKLLKQENCYHGCYHRDYDIGHNVCSTCGKIDDDMGGLY